MARYELRFKKSVAKDLRAIPKSDVRRILRRIEDLATNPRGPDAKKLRGGELYRIRLGVYRIIYEIEDNILLVQVVR